MVTGPDAVRESPQESSACTSGVNEPHCDGVPAIAPEKGSSETPGGSMPERTDQVGEPIAPLTAGVSSKWTPTCATGAGGMVRTKSGASTVSASVTLARLVGHVGS